MALLGMQVLVEINDEKMGSFPRAFFKGDKINDGLIKTYLLETRDDIDYDSEVEHDITFYADEISRLLLVIIDFNNEEPYLEALDPYIFWPYKESKAHAVKRAKYRE